EIIVGITTENVTEDKDSIFTISINKPVSKNVEVILSNGDTVIIEAGETSAEYKVNAQGDDVIKDPSSVTVTLAGAKATDGTEFEKLTLSPQSPTSNITDTDNTVEVNLSVDNINPTEGDTVTFKVSLEDLDGVGGLDRHTGVKVTLSNGVVIEIPAGEIEGT
ncbi:immunoglobulin-like domain-containing protein, partial [Aliarcobacter cryaerophilus]